MPSSFGLYAFNPQPEPPRMRLLRPRVLELGCCAAESAAYYAELGQLDDSDLITGGGLGASVEGTGNGWDDDDAAEQHVGAHLGTGDDDGGGVIDLPTGKPAGQTPGSVPVRPDNWNLDVDPAEYTIAGGDTFVGLTKTYLDASGERWRELWNYGWNRQKFPSPDVIQSTGPLQMPPEATERFKAWLKKGKPGGTTPSKLTQKQIDETKGLSMGAKIAIGGALVVATGAGLYFLSKGMKKRRG